LAIHVLVIEKHDTQFYVTDLHVVYFAVTGENGLVLRMRNILNKNILAARTAGMDQTDLFW
jgi:hypothetical protein